MFKPVSSCFFKDERTKAYKYRCVEAFDRHAPSLRASFLGFAGAVSFSWLFFSGINFELSAYSSLLVTLAVNACFIDLLAPHVPNAYQLSLDIDEAGYEGYTTGERAARVWNKHVNLGL